MHDTHHQRRHDGNHQHQVHIRQTRALVRIVAEDFLDVAVAATRLQGDVADASALGSAQQEGGEHHPGGTADHGRQHGDEVLGRIQPERGNGPGCRPTPRAHATHDAQRQHGHRGQDHRVHANALVQRQHGGAGDHVGGGAVTVERHQQRQQRGTDGDLDRVAIDALEDLADQRVEQAGIDHQAEEQDGEQQQRCRGRHHFQAIKHHLAQFGGEATDHSEDNGYHGERNDWRQAFAHDQVGEGHHHDQAQECEHGLFSCFYSIAAIGKADGPLPHSASPGC